MEHSSVVCLSLPRVPEYHVPASRRPMSPRPRVSRPSVPESHVPASHVPASHVCRVAVLSCVADMSNTFRLIACCFFQWKCVVIVSSEVILLGDGIVFAHESSTPIAPCDDLGLVYTSDGSDGSGVVSGVGIGRNFWSSVNRRKRNRKPRFQRNSHPAFRQTETQCYCN